MSHAELYNEIKRTIFEQNPALETELRAGVPDAKADFGTNTAMGHVVVHMAINDVTPRTIADLNKIRLVFNQTADEKATKRFINQLADTYDIEIPQRLLG